MKIYLKALERYYSNSNFRGQDPREKGSPERSDGFGVTRLPFESSGWAAEQSFWTHKGGMSIVTI